MPDMRGLLSRRLEDLAARKRLYVWARTQSGIPISPGAKPVICVWHSNHGSRNLPDVAVAGLASAVLVGHSKPLLYSFDKFENIPAGVELRYAGDFMSVEEFKIFEGKGIPLPIISDVVRLRVLCSLNDDYAWFWDVDTLVLVDLCRIGVQPDAFEHVLASMERPRSMTGCTTAEFEEKCISQFLCTPRDKASSL